MNRLSPDLWLARPGFDALVEALGSRQMRLVGGAVRDHLLKQAVSDIDLATRLIPGEVMACLEQAGIKAVPTGIAHGTVTAVTEGGPIEITTLRRDVSTDGRHATVAFTEDWQEDAARRDFTINALSADPLTGEVFDYFGGRDDLNAGRVRFIGEPLARIAEDHLRILRLFRFHARFGRGQPDADAYAAAKARANDLMTLSRERIASELLKLLGSPSPQAAVRAMLDGHILKPVLPEIFDDAALERLVAREAEFGIAGDAVRRLAALLGRDPASAADVAARLRLSKVHSRQLISACARQTVCAKELAYRLGRALAIDQLLVSEATAEDIRTVCAWDPPALPIKGGQIVALGLAEGPAIAKALKAIEDRWIAADFPEGAGLESLIADVIQESRARI